MKLSHAIGYCSLMLALGTSCNRNIAPQEHFPTSPVEPDGNASEWTMPLRYANSQYTLTYSISNDSRNIYVCVMTTDAEMKHRIMKAGMTLYFDPKGKQKKKSSVYGRMVKKNTFSAFNCYLQQMGIRCEFSCRYTSE